MCGVVGYIGRKTASDVLLQGLKRLEYRGYDSAGLAVRSSERLAVRRTAGRVASLSELVSAEPVPGHLGIAHTRWATHGAPSERNAHPHLDASGRIAIVHNGVIENHAALREFLERQGIEFQSETDTESLAQLIGFFYEETGDFLESLRSALREVRGPYGVAAICADVPGVLLAARRGSPLLVGIGNDEFLVSSDGSAIVSHTSQVVYLDDNEIASLGPDGMRVTTIDDQPVEKQVEQLEVKLDEIELGGHEHHMAKEIFEQPEAIRNALRGRIDLERSEVVLGGLSQLERKMSHYKRVLLFGCGTAWHASLIGQYLFEELAHVPARVEYASELRYRNPIVEERTLAIAVSQSGETADTLAALLEVQTKGARAIGVVNVAGSSIARATDAGVYLHVGPEIGVASTKAFTAQVTVLALIAAHVGRRRFTSVERTAELLRELAAIPDRIEAALETDRQVREIAARHAEAAHWMYLGRGVNYPTALEGALKLKEVSYAHAEGLPAAEMKHGPIAMIDAGMPVVVVAPTDRTYDKVIANIEEVRCRQGHVIAVAFEGDRRIETVADEVIYVPPTDPMLSPLVTSIPLQLLAYHTAVCRGLDVDKPRNLAKSVTVE